MPKISIVIPVYNTEKYLQRCLDSVINQTFQDIEIICVDDGSTDGSSEILKKYNDERIKIIKQNKKGVSSARNAALEIVSGDYLLFLDSDDWLEENMIEIINQKTADEESSDIIFFNFQFHHKDKSKTYKISKKPQNNPFNLELVVWNKAYRTGYLKEHNIRFCETLEISEDRVFCIDVFIKKPKISFINKVLYNYQIREKSLSHKNYKFVFENMIKACQYLESQEYFINADKKTKTLIKNVFLKDLRFWYLSANNSKKKLEVLKAYHKYFSKIFGKFGKSNPKDISKNVGILCFASDDTNFGANLVPYAMCQIIKEFGLNPTVINLNTKTNLSPKYQHITSGIVNFRKQFIPLTERLWKPSQFYELNKDFSIFVVGSDQVWNTINTRKFSTQYFLDFAKEDKGIIAYAASFGMETFVGTQKAIKKARTLLKRFDFISVRESSAKEVIHNIFGDDINCTETLDPTLLLTKEHYQKIIDTEPVENNGDYIAFYMLSNDYLKQEAENTICLENFSKKLNIPLINIAREKSTFIEEPVVKITSVAKWLNYIKNASIVVTDSFHGVCFSVIFRKNFIYINKLGGTRAKNLLNLLNLQDRIYNSFADVDISAVYNSTINYDMAENILSNSRSQSLKFLKDSLDCVQNVNYIKSKEKVKIIPFQKIQLLLRDSLL